MKKIILAVTILCLGMATWAQTDSTSKDTSKEKADTIKVGGVIIIRKDADSPAHIIFGRSVPHEALDLVASEKMKVLVGHLRETYDFVIIDSPACLAVSDARLLATLSDCVLYIVKWDKTPREAVANGIKHFADIGYGPLVLVLSNVDMKKHARYGYADTAYYYGRDAA